MAAASGQKEQITIGIDMGGTNLRIAAFDTGGLQNVLAPARMGLRVRPGVAQPLYADLEQQFVFVEERGMRGTLPLAPRQRHPISAVVGIQFIPLIETLFIDEPRLVVHEGDQRPVINFGLHHSHAPRTPLLSPKPPVRAVSPVAIPATQARNCPRIDTSLVPL